MNETVPQCKINEQTEIEALKITPTRTTLNYIRKQVSRLNNGISAIKPSNVGTEILGLARNRWELKDLEDFIIELNAMNDVNQL